MKNLIGLLTFALLIVSIEVKAELSKTTLLSLNMMMIDRTYTDRGVESKSKQTDMDIKVTRIEKQWSYGGIFSTNTNDPSQSNRTSYGLSGGYYSDKDFYINLHYFLSSKYKLDPVTEYTKGTGFGIDLGFLVKITSSFLAGIEITHRNYNYTEITQGGVATPASATHTELIPMFTFAVAFQ